MAVEDDTRGAATGVDQADLKRRNVSGQANGSYIPKEVEQKMDEKTKKQVQYPTPKTAFQAQRYECIVRTMLT